MFQYIEDAWALTKSKSGMFQIRKVFLRKDKLYLQVGKESYVEVFDPTRTSQATLLIVERDWGPSIAATQDSLGRLRVRKLPE